MNSLEQDMMSVQNQHLGDYYVDNTSSYWNAFWLWSNHVRNEQIVSHLPTDLQKASQMRGFFVCTAT